MTSITLRSLADEFGLRLEGKGDVTISGVASLEAAGHGEITFCSDKKFYALLGKTHAAAVILTQDAAEKFPGPRLISANPHADFARIARRLYPPRERRPGIHPTAQVAASASIAGSASVGPFCVIGERAMIGERVWLGPQCTIGDDVQIGADSRLYDRVSLLEGCRIGQRVILHAGAVVGSDGFGYAKDGDQWIKVPQLGTVVIGDDVEIGANTTIDRGALADTVIEEGVKIDNQVQVAHNVRIGAHTAIAGCVGIAGSAVIGRHCAIGGGVGILGHLRIADGSQITATSLVSSSIDEPGMYASHLPVQTAAEWRRTLVRLKQLDELVRRLERLERELAHHPKESGA